MRGCRGHARQVQWLPAIPQVCVCLVCLVIVSLCWMGCLRVLSLVWLPQVVLGCRTPLRVHLRSSAFGLGLAQPPAGVQGSVSVSGVQQPSAVACAGF